MYMTRTPSIKLWRLKSRLNTGAAAFSLAALVPYLAVAAEWPQTFSGQPDFVFEKQELVKETLTKAKEEGRESPTLPTLDDLLLHSGGYNPLNLNKIADERDEPAAAEVTLGLLSTVTPVQQNVLPDVLAEALLDVSEFKVVMENAATTAIRKARVDMNKYNFEKDLARLVLQAVVTSPTQYAIINGRRYHTGDRLHISVPVRVGEDDILAALNAHMPPADAVSEDRYAQYEAARDEVVKAFGEKQAAGGITRMQRIGVKVKRIESRRVVLSVDGKDYDLEIKYRL